MIPKSLIAAVRRHCTCLRDSTVHCRPLGRPAARYRAKKTEGLEPIPGLYCITDYRQRSRVGIGTWSVIPGSKGKSGVPSRSGIDDGLGLPRPRCF